MFFATLRALRLCGKEINEGTQGVEMTSDKPESDLPPRLAKPAQRALVAAGYVRLEQLATVSEAELLKLHGMGPKALGQLRQALADKGLSFAVDS
jgi:hypothetical protein